MKISFSIAKFKGRRNNIKSIAFAIGTYGLYQLGTALFAIIKVPLTIKSIGIAEFGILATAISLWAIFSIPGESSRRIARISYFQSKSLPVNGSLFKIDVLYVAVFGLIFAAVYFTLSNYDSILFITLLLIFSSAAMLNSHLGIYYGALEGAQKTEIANLLMISGASLGFLIYTWVLKTNSLVLISLAQALSMIIPGVLIMSYIKITKFELGFRQVALNEIIKLRLKWSTLNFFELLTFALNGFMVLIVLGSTSAAELSLYQKIMIIGSAATSSLGPFYGLFMDSSNQDFKSQIIRRVNIILTICIIFLILLLGSEIFRILGNGEVVMNTEILHLVLANALVGALTASTIQRSNSGHALKVRIVSTGISSLITIVVSALLLPSYGLGVVFAANASASLFVFLALKYYGVRIEN